MVAKVICRRLDLQPVALASALARPRAGSSRPARIAMMAMTTSSSMSVNAPAWDKGFFMADSTLDQKWSMGNSDLSLDFPEHLVNPNQRRVHHLLPGANFRRRHRIVGAVATLGHGFNGREVLMVAVAVAEKEKLFHPRPFLQTDRVVAEKFAGNTDERGVTIQQSHGQPRPNAPDVLVNIIGHQFRKKSDRVGCPGQGIRQISAGGELQPFFAHDQRW